MHGEKDIVNVLQAITPPGGRQTARLAIRPAQQQHGGGMCIVVLRAVSSMTGHDGQNRHSAAPGWCPACNGRSCCGVAWAWAPSGMGTVWRGHCVAWALCGVGTEWRGRRAHVFCTCMGRSATQHRARGGP
eukprot:359159-Chlamydomonas_euryale.AAC.7